MAIQVGDRVKVSRVGMSTDSSDKNAWRSIDSSVVDQVKHMRSLTVTEITNVGSLKFLENSCYWPSGMFEVISGEDVYLSQEEKDILRELLLSRISTYNKLFDKLT